MTDRKRLLQVTEGNLRQSHFYITRHLDFFPKSAFGGSKRGNSAEGAIEIFFDGLNEAVKTDIGSDLSTGKPRCFLRPWISWPFLRVSWRQSRHYVGVGEAWGG